MTPIPNAWCSVPHLMTDVQHEGQTGRVRSRQVLCTPPVAPYQRGKP